MLLIMSITLYTSRVVLDILGIENYGIYNVVGSVIVLFTFINGAMSAATQRYLNYELGTGNLNKLKTVFSTSLIIHIVIAAIILVIGETAGLWLLENKIVIPENRTNAAFWVYQISIASCIVGIVSIPYNAAIIAHEKMNVFAYISILEVVVKLLAVYLLLLVKFDKLIFYAASICVIQIIIRFVYGWYCKRNFAETRFIFSLNRKLSFNMLSFCGWNLFGSIAHASLTEGTNILLNMFFGATINAAKGISTQVQTAVYSLCVNFQIAINPQIVKNYASGDIKYVHKLIFTGSRLSFYLVLLFSVPIMLETDRVLHLWLKNIPDYSALFIQLSMIISMFHALANPLITGNAATGNVRPLMATVGLIFWLVVPISYVCLKLGGKPQTVFLAQIGLMLAAHVIRINIVGKQLNFSFFDYFKRVLWQILSVLIVCFIPPYIVKFNMAESLPRFVFVTVTSTFSILITVFFIGINSEERNIVKRFIFNKLNKWNSNP
jgi:O-antigen/teichoic acid export membrane protein